MLSQGPWQRTNAWEALLHNVDPRCWWCFASREILEGQCELHETIKNCPVESLIALGRIPWVLTWGHACNICCQVGSSRMFKDTWPSRLNVDILVGLKEISTTQFYTYFYRWGMWRDRAILRELWCAATQHARHLASVTKYKFSISRAWFCPVLLLMYDFPHIWMETLISMVIFGEHPSQETANSTTN
jgi:hypothetical protein